MTHSFGETVIKRVLPDQSWLGSYAAALSATSMGETSQRVVLEDSTYIADRAVPPPGAAGWRNSRIRTGAVMGAVQSGKTASMIGVLARALDNGVNVAVVLAGTQTSLWQQTLRRVSDQLDSAPQRLRRRVFLPRPGGSGGAQQPGPAQAYAITEAAAAKALARGRPLIFVAMKQVDHLLHLGKTLHRAVYPAAASADVAARLLVIDDEADDSSIADDGIQWGSPELEIFKQVPRRIVDLWENRSRPGRTAADHVYATYVAYTATPQANFLQGPQNPLAPRDFVAALRTPGETGSLEPRTLTYRVPEGLAGWYTGGDVFYGDLASTFCTTSFEAASNADGSEHVDTDEAFTDDALIDSVRAYLVAAAVRLSAAKGRLGPFSAADTSFGSEREARDSVAPVTSMLVHPSSTKEAHFEVADLLRRWWAGDGSTPSAGVVADIEQNEMLWETWVSSYRSTAQAVSERYEALAARPTNRHVPQWDEVRSLLLSETVPGTRIAVINSDPDADDRPDFAPYQEDGAWRAPRNLSTIFVSGNVMSRGLTLEGLLTTHFTRSSASPLADTQMQMQRWFGYRGAYVHLCRVFLSPEQLSLFTQYADTDHALRSQVLAAMEKEQDSLPDFTVLQGTSFRATGKVSGLAPRQLRPGSKPLVRHLNPAGQDDTNLVVVRDFFLGSHKDEYLHTGTRGLLSTRDLSLLETAELLDRLRYQYHGRIPAEAARWAALESQLGLAAGSDPECPLYRAPEPEGGESLDLGARSPYTIAAYLRFWAAALDRQVRGLMTDDVPPQRWNLLNLDAKREKQPRFRVGLRFGGGPPVESGPLRELGARIQVPLRTMDRRVQDNSLQSDWGSRTATSEGYAGDDLFDFLVLGETPDVDSEGTRLEGSTGLVLFQLIAREGDDRGSISVGLSIPAGGPDHVEAVTTARRAAHGTDS